MKSDGVIIAIIGGGVILVFWLLVELVGGTTNTGWGDNLPSDGWGFDTQATTMAFVDDGNVLTSQQSLRELAENAEGDYDAQLNTGNSNTKENILQKRLTEKDIYFDRISETFHIGSVQGLCVLRDIVNGTNQVEVLGYFALQDDLANKMHVVLDDNIDMSSVPNWRPFQSFVGVFDGKHYTISNLRAIGSGSHGLFKKFGQNGCRRSVLRNLTIKNAFVSESTRSGAFAGVIVNSVLQHCEYIDTNYKSGRVTVEAYAKEGRAGGIAGVLDNVFALYCGVKCNVKEYSAYADAFSGSIQKSYLVGCYALSNINEMRDVETAAGFPAASHSTFVGCVAVCDGSAQQAAHADKLWPMNHAVADNDVISCYGGRSVRKAILPHLAEINGACDDWFQAHTEYPRTAQMVYQSTDVEFEMLNRYK